MNNIAEWAAAIGLLIVSVLAPPVGLWLALVNENAWWLLLMLPLLIFLP